jgi:MoxR-like ATPase
VLGHSSRQPVEDAGVLLERALFEVKKVVVGQDRMVERMVVALLARGHCLLEGVPGVAKSLAVETLATVVGGSSVRLQFTPDLVPSDIVGTRVYRPSQEAFDVELGPVFANLVLADEINRAPAKVQSALLEVMAERQVSIGGTTYPLPSPFLVLATQNPIESEGVYPLPEAQRDRFLMKVEVGHPTMAEEMEIVRRMSVAPPYAEQVLSLDELRRCRRASTASSCTTPSGEYAVRLVMATREPERWGLPHIRPHLAHGASPRGSLGLVQGLEGARGPARPRLRAAGRRRRPGRRRPGPPPRADVRGARRRGAGDPSGRAGPREGRPAAGRARRSSRRSTGARARAWREVPLMRRRAPTPALPPPPLAPEASVRRLSLQVARRLDGILQGEHLGYLPGPGTEPAEARAYSPGDDVRRIDWAVTARTGEPHVRQSVAERELETTLVVDLTASMSFGTARSEKRDVAVALAAAFSHLAVGPGDRLGAVVLSDAVRRVPARQGKLAALALLHVLQASRPEEGVGPSLAEGLRVVASPPRRRGPRRRRQRPARPDAGSGEPSWAAPCAPSRAGTTWSWQR